MSCRVFKGFVQLEEVIIMLGLMMTINDLCSAIFSQFKIIFSASMAGLKTSDHWFYGQPGGQSGDS